MDYNETCFEKIMLVKKKFFLKMKSSSLFDSIIFVSAVKKNYKISTKPLDEFKKKNLLSKTQQDNLS